MEKQYALSSSKRCIIIILMLSHNIRLHVFTFYLFSTLKDDREYMRLEEKNLMQDE